MNETALFAIEVGGDWRIAKIVKASAYGEPMSRGLNWPANTEVWSDVQTTALLCRVGEEKQRVALPPAKPSPDAPEVSESKE